ncbi:carboxymuconolactone decarboxylase family protein [Amycolatopsis anabasis]|uniref:carboxymuconolactone decarboxylase family protein n=1 Tax=Amycolatopsis anabasis TaxID=1840409 RepID=UPI00131D9AA4|nr:carboxymuconolactone decarboxylase family protein [Amycolatopsis anabasis]
MSKRIPLTTSLPEAYQQLLALNTSVEKAAANAGLDPKLVELVKIRASQLNGCAFCLDMHTHDTLKQGEDERRIFVLPAWRETELYTEQERAALALTEAITKLAATQDVPDDVYEAAMAVFTEEQVVTVVWAATVINAFNRLSVTARKPLPKVKR